MVWERATAKKPDEVVLHAKWAASARGSVVGERGRRFQTRFHLLRQVLNSDWFVRVLQDDETHSILPKVDAILGVLEIGRDHRLEMAEAVGLRGWVDDLTAA